MRVLRDEPAGVEPAAPRHGAFFLEGRNYMDRITSALLTEFSRENQLEDLPEETRFEHFATYLATSRHVADTFDTADLVAGAGRDTGIDAIAIVINGSLVTDSELVAEFAAANGYLDVTFVFVQAERSERFQGAKIGTFGFGVCDFFQETPKLPRNAAIAEAASIMSAIYDSSPLFTKGNPVCRLYYVTTGHWVDDANLAARQQTIVDDLRATHLFRDVDFLDVGANTIQRLYNQTKKAISRDVTFASKTALPRGGRGVSGPASRSCVHVIAPGRNRHLGQEHFLRERERLAGLQPREYRDSRNA